MKNKVLATTGCTLLLTLCYLSTGCSKEIEPDYKFSSVDLGLSVLWAETNVGAEMREDFGFYLAWGETSGKEEYNPETYKWYDENGKITKYCSYARIGFEDNLMTLEKEDDAASMENAGWRTPTLDEFEELLTNCTWTLSALNGVRGFKVTSNVTGYEGNYIFLPAAGMCNVDETPIPGYNGYYWTSENEGGKNSRSSYGVNIKATGNVTTSYPRYIGCSVRAVRDKN